MRINKHNYRGILIVTAVLFSLLLVISSPVFSNNASKPNDGRELTDEEAIERFNEIAHDSFHSSIDKGETTNWLGIRSHQNPCDNWAMQEIISEIKPDFIIETGTFYGGTTLFYATILEKVNENGRVITVDINPRIKEASKFKTFKEKVEVIKGDCVSPEVIDRIAKCVKGHTVLVTLDSMHTKEHVLKELKLYSNFVSLGSYIVVQDTRKNFHPEWGPGPIAAVEEFLKTNDNFIIDHSREKFILTWYPSGFLKRIK